MAIDPTLYGVLIGGAFALAGTALGSAISFWNARAERKEKRRDYLRARLEEIADQSSKSVEWVLHVGNCRTLDELRPHTMPGSSRRIYLLSLLYFPRLKDTASDYHNELIRYHCLAADAVGTGILTAGAEMARRGVYEDVATKVRQFRQRLDDAIAHEAEKFGRA